MQLVYFNIDKCTWYNHSFAIAVYLLIILSNESVILHHSKKNGGRWGGGIVIEKEAFYYSITCTHSITRLFKNNGP
jgi:hypothetical protein